MIRSGIKIIFNDEQRSIHIEDPSGNTWDMDGQGNITVNAPNTITMNAKNININAEESVGVNAGADISETAGGNVSQTAGNTIIQSAANDFLLSASNITHTASKSMYVESDTMSKNATNDITYSSSQGNVTIHAQRELNNNSGGKNKLF